MSKPKEIEEGLSTVLKGELQELETTVKRELTEAEWARWEWHRSKTWAEIDAKGGK